MSKKINVLKNALKSNCNAGILKDPRLVKNLPTFKPYDGKMPNVEFQSVKKRVDQLFYVVQEISKDVKDLKELQTISRDIKGLVEVNKNILNCLQNLTSKNIKNYVSIF